MVLGLQMPLDTSILAVYQHNVSSDLNVGGFAVSAGQGCSNHGVTVVNDGNIPTAHVYPCSMPSAAVQTQLAPVPPLAGSQDFEALTGKKAKEVEFHVKPSPSHFMMCGYSLLLGALEATANIGEEKSWLGSFKQHSQEAASSVAPMSRYLLDKHVFCEA